MNLPDVDFTCNLFKILSVIIGQNDCVEFPDELIDYLEVVEIKLKKSKTTLYHIQHPSELYHITKPVLWKYNAWLLDSKRLSNLKQQSDLERRQRYAQSDNIKIIARAYKKLTDNDMTTSIEVATRMLLNNKQKQIKQLLKETNEQLKTEQDYINL